MRIPGATLSYMTSFALPLATRSRVDVLRLARAERDGGPPPSLRAVLLEGLELLLAREEGQAKQQ